jgi:hypothetical protein
MHLGSKEEEGGGHGVKGAAAGAIIGVALSHPLERMKTKAQTRGAKPVGKVWAGFVPRALQSAVAMTIGSSMLYLMDRIL